MASGFSKTWLLESGIIPLGYYVFDGEPWSNCCLHHEHPLSPPLSAVNTLRLSVPLLLQDCGLDEIVKAMKSLALLPHYP